MPYLIFVFFCDIFRTSACGEACSTCSNGNSCDTCKDDSCIHCVKDECKVCPEGFFTPDDEQWKSQGIISTIRPVNIRVPISAFRGASAEFELSLVDNKNNVLISSYGPSLCINRR